MPLIYSSTVLLSVKLVYIMLICIMFIETEFYLEYIFFLSVSYIIGNVQCSTMYIASDVLIGLFKYSIPLLSSLPFYFSK